MWSALVAYFSLSLGSMATMSIGIGCVAAASLYHRKRLVVAGFTREEWMMLVAGIALTLACVLSLLFAEIFPATYGGRTSTIHWLAELPKFWYVLAPPFVSIALRTLTLPERARLIRIWVLAMGVFSLVCFVQFFTGWPRPQEIPGFAPYFHMTGFLGHHLSLASIWIFPVFVGLALFREDPRANRWLGLAAVLGLIALVGSFSRTVWVALPIGLFALWVIERFGKISGKRLIVGAVAGLILVGAASQLPFVRSRLEQNIGISDRQELWLANFKFVADRPLLGVGFRHNQELGGYYLEEKLQSAHVFAGHAHNNLIDMLGGTGLVGALAWVLWCVLATVVIWRRVREGSAVGLGLLCAWIVFQINGLTQVNFWEGKVEHQLLIALALALSERRASERRA